MIRPIPVGVLVSVVLVLVELCILKYIGTQITTERKGQLDTLRAAKSRVYKSGALRVRGGLTMADGSTAVIDSKPKPISRTSLWLFLIAVAAVLVTTVLLLPNKPNVFGGYSTRQLAYL